MRGGKHNADQAFAIAKRVILDFGERKPGADAKAFLEKYRNDGELGSKIDTVKPLDEGYAKRIEVTKPEDKSKKTRTPRKPKNLIRLTMKDGSTMVGSIVGGRSGAKIFFKVYGRRSEEA